MNESYNRAYTLALRGCLRLLMKASSMSPIPAPRQTPLTISGTLTYRNTIRLSELMNNPKGMK